MRMAKPSGCAGTPCARILGVILAGGKSSRMGKDKSSLQYRGMRLVDHIAISLRETGVTGDIVISGEITGGVKGCVCVPDLKSGLGPLGGLYSVLNKYPGRSALVIPVDMPAMTGELLRELAMALNESRNDAAVFYGTDGDHELPIALNATEHVLREIKLLLNKDGNPKSRSIRELISRLKIRRLALRGGTEQFFANANTPDDWRTFNESTILA